MQAGIVMFPVNIDFDAPDVIGSFSGGTVSHPDLYLQVHAGVLLIFS